jgi:heme oxygenase
VILPRLKQATAARHAAVESRSVLLDRQLSRATYRECLRRFFGYYAPLELRLLRSQAWHGAGLAYGDRQKTPRLSQDLAALGVTPEELAQTPLCHALPDLRSTARLFGCLYVIEGATLGGQIVTRHLQASLGVTPQSGGAFFSGYAEHTGSRWKAFGAHLTEFALASGADDEIVASANETFETLDRWLYPAPPQGTPHDEPASRR